LEFLNTVDYTIISVYFVILIGLSLYLKKMASKNLESYFLGGRSLPWWMLGVSGMASMVDMTGTMLAVSFMYMLGTRGMFIEGFRGAACLFLAVVLVFTGKYNRRSGCMTGAEWMAYRFGEGFGGQFARITMAISKIAWAVGMIGYLVKGAGLFLSMFVPLQPWQCAMIMVALGTVYIMVAGFYGVVFADMFQGAIILSAVIAITIMAVVKVTGHTDFASLAVSITGNPDWMSSKFHFGTVTMPQGYKQYECLWAFSCFYIMRSVFLGMGMGDDPKYFGARSDRECGTLSFMWTGLMMFRWPLMMGFAVLGIFLVKDLFPDQAQIATAAEMIKGTFAGVEKSQWIEKTTSIIRQPEKFPELVTALTASLGQSWAKILPMVSFEGTVNPERVVPAVILNVIPMGFRGLFLTALIAASISTFGFTANMVTAFFTRDLYQRYIRKAASNAELILASRIFTVVVVAIGFYFGTKAKNINDIWAWVTMALLGGLIAPLFLRFYWWRFNGGGFATGTLVGMVGAVVLKSMEDTFAASESLAWLANEKWMFVTLLMIGLVGSIAGTFLTRPTNQKVLDHFYKTTLPLGFWGPLKKRLSPQVQTKVTKEHFNDIIALFFTMTWMITLFMMPMQAIIGSWGALKITAILFAICMAGMYIFWYRHLPAKNFYEDDEVHLSDE